MSENVVTLDFIGLMARLLLKNFSGAVLAIRYVGQRDTRWLTPLTVSGWGQGEEGASQISNACSYPTAASVFLFIGVFHYMLRFQRRDYSQNPEVESVNSHSPFLQLHILVRQTAPDHFVIGLILDCPQSSPRKRYAKIRILC